MRDKICEQEKLRKAIVLREKTIASELEEIEILKVDIENCIQRYPKKNEDVIFSIKIQIFNWLEEEIRAQYSLGLECNSIESLFGQAKTYISEISYSEIGYIHILEFIALGILLEVSEDEFKILVNVIDEAKVDDILLDCLINAYGIKRNYLSSKYEKEIPYKEAVEIMELANVDKIKAALKLEEYVQKKWLKGHSDYGWTTAHKEAGYYGLWSFEAAAIAKIFNLEDSKLKEDNHYPYDLAHYKNNMTFNKDIDFVEEEIIVDVGIEKFIPANPDLEEIIPDEFRDEINQLLVDFSSLEDEEFWIKYNLTELWDTVDVYQKDKINKHIIGNIVINQLVVLGYILQLDYKEDIENYVDNIKNYWNTQDIKLIRFELDNDQEYYAKVPVSCKIKNIYSVNICE